MKMMFLSLVVGLACALLQVSGDQPKQKNDTQQHQNEKSSKLPITVIQDGVNGGEGKSNQDAQTSDGSKQSHDWIDKVNACSTVVIAVFTILLFVGVVYQVRTARNSERAWMMGIPEFNNFTKPPEPDECVLYPASFKNFGRTPARIVEAGLSLKLAQSFKSIPHKPIYTPEETKLLGNLIVPKDSFILTARPLALSVTEYHAIKNGDLLLYAHGFVKYRDVFNNKRETRFCHYYMVPAPDGPDKGFQAYPDAPREYNEAA
jgi:hypothetical protein